jgi:filamentous hemagglutinin family protein
MSSDACVGLPIKSASTQVTRLGGRDDFSHAGGVKVRRPEFLRNSGLRKPCGVPKRANAISSLIACLFPALSYALDPNALPTGGAVASGAASINQSGARLNILQQSSQAILNWNTFNIGSQASVVFQQPGAASVALNRVASGGGVSEIYGSLSANGQVFLINPAGTIFGRGAQVNVGGLVASSLDISNENFLKGNYRFAVNGTAGAILNQGTLTAADGGYIALLAPQVRNEGVLAARLGTVAIGAGEAVRLDMNGTGLIEMQVERAAVDALIANRNLVEADGGVVFMGARAAGELAGGVINNSGEIRAERVTEVNGVIRLEAGEVSNSGSIAADGVSGGKVTLVADTTIHSGVISVRGSEGHGGEVRLLGDRIGLFGEGSIDASGATGGGTVLVGGNFQGKGPEANASMVYVSPNALIRADAGATGDGGKVIVWSNEETVFAGSLLARGGSTSGNGGFAEVSGKNALDFNPRQIQLTAPNGRPGELLLDPMNIIVATGGGAAHADVSTFAAQPGTTQTIDPATLNAVGATVNLQATNDVTVNNAINLTTAGAGLFARAGNSINVNASITTTNGSISLSARDPGGTQTGVGTVNLNAGGTLNSTNGNISLTNNNGTSPISLAEAINGGAGAVSVLSGGTIVESGAGLINTSGILTMTSVGGMTLNGANTIGTIQATNITSGNVAITNTKNPLTIGSLNNSGGGSITVNNTGALNITGTMNSGNGAMNLISTASISESGVGLINTGTGTLTTSSNGGLTLNGANVVGTFNATNTTGGPISLTNTANLVITGITQSAGAGVTVANTGNLSTSGAISTAAGGNISLTATNGTETIGAAVTAGGAGTVNLSATGATSDILVNAGVSSTSGVITANAGRDMTISGAAVSTGGSSNITTGRDLNLLATANSALLQSVGMNINAAGGLKLQGGTGTNISASVQSVGGNQTIAANTINLLAGSIGNGNFAQILNNGGNQNITASSGISLTAGGSGGVLNAGNYAQIRGFASQNITVGSAGLTLTAGSGGAGNTDNGAFVIQSGLAGTSQTIAVNGGGSIVMTGGSSGLTGVGATHGSRALIQADGDSQQINFNAGGAMNLTGGTAGSRAYALIQSTTGSQTVTGSPTMTLTGGASGGIDGEGNFAGMFAQGGIQTITSGNMTLNAGAGGINNFSSVNAATNNVTVNGNLALTGGGSANGTQGGGAGLGGPGGGTTNLTLNVTGNVSVIGGSVAGAGIGSAGIAGGQINNIALTAGGSVTLGPGTGAGARIGSPPSNVGGGNISVTAGGAITLNDNPTQGTGIFTTGNVTLQGSAISDGVNGQTKIQANTLTAHSTAGSTSLTSPNNSIASFSFNANGGSVSLTDAGGVILNGGTTTGNFTLTAGGAVTQTGALTVAGTSTISVGANPITLTNAANNFQGLVTLSNSGTSAVQITDVNTIDFGNMTLGGAFTVNAPTIIARDTTNTGNQLWNGNVTFNSTETTNGGNFTVAGTTTLGNTSTIVTGGGNVTFGGAVNGTVAGAQGLTVNSSGATTFGGAVPLAFLVTDAPGTTSVGGNVTTTGAQVFGDPTSGAPFSTLSSTGGGQISINNSSATFPEHISTIGPVSITGTSGLGSGLGPLIFNLTPSSLQVTQPINVTGNSPAIPATLVINPAAVVTLNGMMLHSTPVAAPASQSPTPAAESAQSVSTTSPTPAPEAVVADPAPTTTPTTIDAGTVRPTASSGVSMQTIRQIDQQIAQARTELYSPALAQIALNPAVADVPECGDGGQGACVAKPKAKAAEVTSGDAEPVIKRKVALLIGNDRYLAPISALETPINDVEAIGKVLKERLGYDARIVRNATRNDIVNELNRLVTESDIDDSVMVVYAGHGYQAEKDGSGYWIPVDGSNTDASTWLSNSAISKFLGNIAARQVMLISDSCYSGTLAQEQKVRTSDTTVFDRNDILRKRSVMVMSSGGSEPVTDGGHDNHSLFAYHLIRNLSTMPADLVGSDIHERVRAAVVKEYPQDPQYGAVVSAGHTAGGEYLIERKQ